MEKHMKKVLLTVLTSMMLAGAAVTNPSVAEAKRGSATYSSTPADTRDVIAEIIDVIGLKPRFEVRAANVPNAAATIINGKRYILYNERFLSSVNNAVRTDWAGISILAHEMGHHLNGHTLNQGGSNVNDELEADEFSGFVLRKMGASLSETQAAIKVLADDHDSRTHPGRNSRLAAINKGWRNAESHILASAKAGTPTRSVAAPSRSAAIAAAPAPTARRATASRINAQHILRQVKLQGAPEEMIYVTTTYNVVRETEDGVQVIGKMQKTGSPNFPYVLESQYLPSIFVTTDGLLLNKDGKRVGVLTT